MRRISVYFITILLFFSVIFVSAFIVNISSWQSNQDYVYQSGYGQKRESVNFIPDSSSCGGSGTMYDNLTNLCWEKSPSTSSFTWVNAVSRCSGLSTAGGGWSLPEKAQLVTLLYHNGVSTTYNRLNSVLGFSNIQNAPYWTGTTYATSTSNAYVVDFSEGRSVNLAKTNSLKVICVKKAS